MWPTVLVIGVLIFIVALVVLVIRRVDASTIFAPGELRQDQDPGHVKDQPSSPVTFPLVTRIAGVTYGKRQSSVRALRAGDEVILSREPANPNDGNAIAILNSGGWPLGYVVRDIAAGLAPMMDANRSLRCRVVGVAEAGSTGVYGARISIEESHPAATGPNLPGQKVQRSRPSPDASPRFPRVGQKELGLEPTDERRETAPPRTRLARPELPSPGRFFRDARLDNCDQVSCLGVYHPYRRGSNQEFDDFSRTILDLKECKAEAVEYFFNALEPAVLGGLTIAVVPSHDAGPTASGVTLVARRLVQAGGRDATGALVRQTAVEKLSLGGSRELSHHLSSIAVVKPQLIRDRDVLLLDDVTTSGNSLEACKRLLIGAGARRVKCVALARTAGGFGLPTAADPANDGSWISRPRSVSDGAGARRPSDEVRALARATSPTWGLLVDLDGTLVDSSALNELRDRREWTRVQAAFGDTAVRWGIRWFVEEARSLCRVGVVTSSPRRYAEGLLAHHEIDLSVLVAYQDVKNHKPHPEPLLKGASLLGLAPSRCFHLGDEATDTLAARAAGAVALGVNWDGPIDLGCPVFSEWPAVIVYIAQTMARKGEG